MKARFFLASVAVTAYRPCVVVSSDEMNAHLHTVIVAPMTTGSPPAAFRITLAA
jgi:mRNA-degrading endonuclease toxin of MazEF toxin-antitoxin module